MARHCDEAHNLHPLYLRNKDKTVQYPYSPEWRKNLLYPKPVTVRIPVNVDSDSSDQIRSTEQQEICSDVESQAAEEAVFGGRNELGEIRIVSTPAKTAPLVAKRNKVSTHQRHSKAMLRQRVWKNIIKLQN